jgi:hypothetical protein
MCLFLSLLAAQSSFLICLRREHFFLARLVSVHVYQSTYTYSPRTTDCVQFSTVEVSSAPAALQNHCIDVAPLILPWHYVLDIPYI